MAACLERRDPDDRPPGPVFFALRPDAEAAGAAMRVRHRLWQTQRPAGPVRPPELLHVSLVRLGTVPELAPAVVAAAIGAGEAIMRAPFRMTFDQAVPFRARPGKAPPLVLMARDAAWQVNALRLALIEELAMRRIPFDRASCFTPHMTLHYGACAIPPQPVPPISWTVHEFLLIHSHHGETRHEVVQRWRLPEA